MTIAIANGNRGFMDYFKLAKTLIEQEAQKYYDEPPVVLVKCDICGKMHDEFESIVEDGNNLCSSECETEYGYRQDEEGARYLDAAISGWNQYLNRR